MKKSFGKRTSQSLLRSAPDIPPALELSVHPSRVPTDEAPTCDSCGSSDFLVYEHVELRLDRRRVQPPCWDVEFWCGQCESFYGMLTTQVPDDRQAVRLASENPRYVRYPDAAPDSAAEAWAGTKVSRDARRQIPGLEDAVPSVSVHPGPSADRLSGAYE
ncbi:hypothetical protein [Paeniglutamicibacter psychrophenolicus]|uniref:Uncharacterized protein n=1 Tax=Paeniglutamicibacter psychrophenolicus TaxID=257454 RepID=A0ABS4WDS0_9MICC|nr:hypothetical protein [Paeniglutamicibacter psychrophenolicus]MBP2374356.1 hypothetical protein [Paeniglutamicibacter psychrophenolicus]